MPDPRIHLKNQYLAAGLTYLLPGAGHLYQGRIFKGVLFLVCIVSTYLFGLYLSEGKAVYWRWEPGNKNIPYFAQAGVGLVAIPAFVQAKRYANQDKGALLLDGPLQAEYRGEMWNRDVVVVGRLSGQIELKTVAGEFGNEIRGTFTGEFFGENGLAEPIELTLSGLMKLGPIVAAREYRTLNCHIVEVEDGNEIRVGDIKGGIPRRFVNRFAAPLENDDLENLNRRLGRYFELAKVFTMIAGLLNVLAVWDALEGPAYGYGDEEESTDKSTDEKSGKSDKVAAEIAAADSTQPASVEPGESQPAEKTAEAEEPVV